MMEETNSAKRQCSRWLKKGRDCDNRKLQVHPVTLTAARDYVNDHHRHHKAPQGGLFALSVGRQVEGRLYGVAIVGRPVARMLDDGKTAEITRLCTDGTPNACSFLYGAACRAARALGYRKIVTYSLPVEGGSSLRASGFRLIGLAGGGSWSRKGRPRIDSHPTDPKLRWERVLTG